MSTDRHDKCKWCDYGYPISSHQDQTDAVTACEEWNAKYPVGTPVIYEEVIGMSGKIYTRTRSNAWVASVQPICKIEGKAGGCSLDHMIVVPLLENK